MQTNKKTRPSQVQSTGVKSAHARYAQEDSRSTLITLAVLCLLLPPIGIFFAWRTRKLSIPLRAAFSALGLISTTVIFCIFMRPENTVSDIRPMPATPQLVGYGTVAAQDAVLPSATEVPAQQESVPANPDSAVDPVAQQEPGELTDDTIVFAVTNNASSYHLYEICDMQENRRAMTLRDALNEGLQPCEKCVGAMG